MDLSVHRIWPQPIVDNGYAFVIYNDDGGAVNAAALRSSNGTPLWQQAIGAVGSAGQPVLMGRQLYGTWRGSNDTSQCTAGEYWLDARTGKVLGVTETVPVSHDTAVPVVGRFVQVATTLSNTGCPEAPSPPQTVVVRKRGGGAVLWQSSPLHNVREVPVVGDGRVSVTHDGGVSAYALGGCGGAGECEPLWTFALSDVQGPPLFAEGQVFVRRFSDGGISLAALDGAIGEFVWGSLKPFPADIAYSQGQVYLTGSGGSGALEAYTASGCGQLFDSGVGVVDGLQGLRPEFSALAASG